MADVIVPTPHNVTELVSEKPVSEMKKEQPEPAEVHPNVVPAKAEVPIIKSLEESEPEKLYTKKDGTKIPETQYALKLGEKYKVLGPTTISLKDIEEQLAKGVEGAVRVPIGSLFKDEKDIGRFTLAQRTVCKTNDVDPNDPYNYINAMTMKGLAQAKSDKKECIKETFFENVNETIKSSLAGVHIPKTVEEIQKIVRDAAAKKQKVRVVGAGHSWTPVFPEDGSILVSLFDYKGGITSDLKGKEEDWTITFKAGERIKDVQEYCEPHGINIPTNVVMDHVGYGGLVSMGCHGTGWNIQTISDQCVGLKLVDAHGEIREFSRKKDGDRIWSAMVTNLGLFGIVFEYTLKVCKNFNVFIYDYKIQSRDLFGPGGEGAFRDLVVNRHSSQIFWMPFNDQLWLKLFEVTDKPVTVKPIKYVWDSFTNWLSMNLGVPIDNLTTKSTELTPLFLKAGFASFMDNKDHPRVEPIYNAIHWEQSLDALKIMCMEFAFPIRENHLEDWANIGKCVRFVQKRVYELSQKKIFPLNLALEMRFIKDSDGLLSTAHGNEHTCFIEIVTSIDAPIWTEFSGEIALKWLKIFPNARPHWAKMCQQVPGIEKVIRTNYGENITKFVEIRNELKVDPHDMFYTQWLGNILEPERFQPYINNVPRVTRGDVDDVAKIGSKEEEEKKKSSKKEKKNEGCKCVLS